MLSLVPIDHVAAPPGEGVAFAIGCAKCLGFGGALGLPVLVVTLLTRRAQVDGPSVVALGGVAAGLTGNMVLQVHCPITDPIHLLMGHAPLLIILGIAASLNSRR